MTVLNSIELEGVSTESWDAAAREAVREAGRTLRRITRFEVLETGASLGQGGEVEFRTSIRLYFEMDRMGDVRPGSAG
jgi:dodecin